MNQKPTRAIAAATFQISRWRLVLFQALLFGRRSPTVPYLWTGRECVPAVGVL